VAARPWELLSRVQYVGHHQRIRRLSDILCLWRAFHGVFLVNLLDWLNRDMFAACHRVRFWSFLRPRRASSSLALWLLLDCLWTYDVEHLPHLLASCVGAGSRHRIGHRLSLRALRCNPASVFQVEAGTGIWTRNRRFFYWRYALLLG